MYIEEILNLCIKLMYFLINEENAFDEYNEIWENASNIIKNIIL